MGKAKMISEGGIQLEAIQVEDPAGTKGEFLIRIEMPSGEIRYTGPGTDWLVDSAAKGQVYKTWSGAMRWVEKSAKGQGKWQILRVVRPQ